MLYLIISFFFSVKWPKCDKRVACSGDWLAVREKCFYFSDDTGNWTASKIFCSLQKSELAQIDTQKDMVRKEKSLQ